MSTVWVYKLDGSQQCGWSDAVSLDETTAQLAERIGKDDIISAQSGRVPLLFPTACGQPTGGAHIFELTEEGAHLLFGGIVGPSGFQLWIWAPPKNMRAMAEGLPLPWPFPWSRGGRALNDTDPDAALAANFISAITQVGAQPTQLTELIGRRCRYYQKGSAITFDYWPDRVNIEHENNIIVRVWFG